MNKIQIYYNLIRRHGRLIAGSGSVICSTKEEAEQVIAKLTTKGHEIAFVTGM